jgi:hypothetical protein
LLHDDGIRTPHLWATPECCSCDLRSGRSLKCWCGVRPPRSISLQHDAGCTPIPVCASRCAGYYWVPRLRPPQQLECDTNAANKPAPKTMKRPIRFTNSHHPSARYHSAEVHKGTIFYTYIHSSRYGARLSLVHISWEMLLRFGKIIARLICDAAHFSSCSGIRFACSSYWLFTQ